MSAAFRRLGGSPGTLLAAATFVGIAGPMVALSSTADVLGALSTAGKIDVLAYTLRRGPVFDGLEAAARRGAHVRVRLEGLPYGDPSGSFARENREIVEALARAGVRAELARTGPGGADKAPVHAKAIVADARVFLDDRNWGPEDLVVCDRDPADVAAVRGAMDGGVRAGGSPSFALEKRAALAREAELLSSASPDADVVVESESFGSGNPVYGALDALGKSGVNPRLLVSSRDANVRERRALARLARDGVRVRITRDTEKFAVVDARAWVGSANASPAFAHPDMIDWGLCTQDPAIVAAARDRAETRWNAAKPFRP
ncbi:MAG: hypothetical protein ABI231_04065 [Candidatus Tumulicola sp.]